MIYRNLFLTMAIAGLWHGGDSWNFLLWGAAHGEPLCVTRIWSSVWLVQHAQGALTRADALICRAGLDVVPRP